ncbi:hypothetical protein RDI58_011027 [Solanum bulbocastanum]|uniref:Ataxin-10 domain-containing protein n=1 Tax=Solanum bulbocastanum TaxID=147425 RepID=A0AAN8TXD9_SOLBU
MPSTRSILRSFWTSHAALIHSILEFFDLIMDDKVVPELAVHDKIVAELTILENVAKELLLVSNSSSLETALEKLIELAKEEGERLDLSSKNVVTTVLHLCQSLSSISYRQLLISSLKVLRNLCAGEIRNQNEFLLQRGVEIVVDVITSVGLTPDPDCMIIRVGLQLLGNYSVGGGERQCDVWYQLFPHKFLKIARVRSREICDPLCMVIYTCCDGTDGLLTDLCSEQGLPILIEILRTASAGYSVTILRDICASDHLTSSKEESSKDVVDVLVSSGLIEFLLNLLRDLEPPTTIRKAMKQYQIKEGTISSSFRCCPYQGFRRDIVSIIGNCAYRRRYVQDEIRDKNGILLLLQQCVIDEDNPFLREWGVWCVRNLLEGNAENQGAITDLELQGTVDVAELVRLGLRVEVDPVTRRTKLVNAS